MVDMHVLHEPRIFGEFGHSQVFDNERPDGFPNLFARPPGIRLLVLTVMSNKETRQTCENNPTPRRKVAKIAKGEE